MSSQHLTGHRRFGTNHFNITISENHYQMMKPLVIIGVIIVVILIIAVLSWLSIHHHNNSVPRHKSSPRRYKIHPDKLKNHTNYGASNDGTHVTPYENGKELTTQQLCEANSNAKWHSTFSRCRCKSPWYGPTCNLEAHDSNYLSLGIPADNSDVTVYLSDNSLASTSVDDNTPGDEETILSFQDGYPSVYPGSCMDQCNTYPEICYGVSWVNGVCGIITEPIVVSTSKNIHYQPHKMSTLFLNTRIPNNYPIFKDRVFAFSDDYSTTCSLPRFWVGSNTGEIKEEIQVGNKTLITFPIASFLNQTGLVGIWSTTDFDHNHAKNLIKSPMKSMYVDWGHDTEKIQVLPVPKSCTQLYVYYIPVDN
jgi:hypothetical protein